MHDYEDNQQTHNYSSIVIMELENPGSIVADRGSQVHYITSLQPEINKGTASEVSMLSFKKQEDHDGPILLTWVLSSTG